MILCRSLSLALCKLGELVLADEVPEAFLGFGEELLDALDVGL